MELQLFFNLFQMPPRNPGKGCCGGEGAEKEDPVPVTLATLQHWSRPPLVLVFLWLENQTILLIMQYNFCFAFGDVFYLTDWLKGSEEAMLTSNVTYFKTRGSKGVRHSQSAGVRVPRHASKDSRLGRRPRQPISRCEGASKNWRKASSAGQEQQGAVCLLLGPPAAYIRVQPHALPSVTLRLSDTEIKESGASCFSRGHHDTTTSHGTLGILVNTYSNV